MLWISKQKFFNRYLPMFLSVVVLVAAMAVYFVVRNQNKTADAAWYNASWGYRKAITIDHNKVSGTASSTINSFPVLINVTDSDLKYTGSGGKVGRTDGLDMVFTSSDGTTTLSYEMEKYSSTTGETIAWVKIPILSAVTDTTIYLYFGNSGASDQSSATNVWDSNYKGVWHLKENPANAFPALKDSTSNAKHLGVQGSGGTQSLVTGKIGDAFNNSKNGQYSTLFASSTSPTGMGTGDQSIEGWVYVNSLFSGTDGNQVQLFGRNQGPGYPFSYFSLMMRDNGKVYAQGNQEGVNGTDTPVSLAPGRWYHLALTSTGSTQKIYINGTVNLTETNPYTITDNGQFSIGSINNVYIYGADAKYDELRMSSNLRNADWVATEYNNQSSPSTFYAYGAVSIQNRAATTPSAGFSSRGTSSLGWYNASWTYRKPITIDHNKVFGVSSSTINSFPILFSVIDSDLKYTGSGGKMASSTGGDLLFTASDGTTKLDFEVEKYASTTGETIAWVRIPILSSVTDTTIYIYFGNNSATDQSNKNGVWDSNFKIVQHLGNGTTLSATDSTSNGVNGTISTPTATTGQIDGAGNFNGSSDIISFSTTTAFATTGAGFSASFWGLISTFASNSYQHAWTIKSNGASSRPWEMAISNQSSYLGLLIGSSNDWAGVKSDNLPPTNTWHYYVATYNGSGASTVANYKLYQDGVLQPNNLPSGFSALTNTTQIGPTSGGGSNFWQGKLDEMRFSSTERNVDWVKTEYGNQFSPSTFYSYGALQINGRQNAAGSTQPAIKTRGGVKFR